MIIKGKEYSIDEAFEKFVDDFVELIHELGNSSSDKGMVNYYSILCQDPKREPSDDIWIFEADLQDAGWSTKELEELFKFKSSEIINRLDDKSRGVGDYFLYKWTNKKFPLAGYDLVKEPEEIMIKYSYGWQRHKYGILFLNQNGFDKDEFLNLVADSFYEVDILSRILYFLDFDMTKSKEEKYKIKFKKFAITKGNTLEIQYKRIVEILNVMNFVEGGSEYEDLVDVEDFKKYIIKSVVSYDASYEEKPNTILCRFDA